MAKRRKKAVKKAKPAAAQKGKTIWLKLIVAFEAIKGIGSLIVGLVIMLLGGAIAEALKTQFVAGTANYSGITLAMGASLVELAGALMAVMGVVWLAVTWGLWKTKNWARIIASIFAALSLFSFPWGTIVGLIELYILWFHEETAKLFK